MSDCPFCDREARHHAIKVTKPERSPPRLLTDTTEGLHPYFGSHYIRRLNVMMENGEMRVLTLSDTAYRGLQQSLFTIRALNNQQRRATRFLRRKRSIRATLRLLSR